MLRTFNQKIQELVFIYAHTGLKPDRNNLIYSIAGAVVNQDGSIKEFSSLVNYAHLTGREYYYSNISKKMLQKAPEPEKLMKDFRKFLDNRKVVFTLNNHETAGELRKLCGNVRFVDLNFAAEFFLSNLKSCSIKNLWEFLFKAEREKISFSAEEAVELSIELVKYICGTELSDLYSPHAPAIRFFLKKSNTLFGNAFIHICMNYQDYFQGLFTPCTENDTENWKQFLEKKEKALKKETQGGSALRGITLGSLYEGLSHAEHGFKIRQEQLVYARHIADALKDKSVLTIEAGTGTGKTQGYLIPVMEFLRMNPKARVVVSTYTKNLQEQIYQKELPMTKNALPIYRDIRTALLKGKSSYICAEKLDYVYDNKLEGEQLLTWLYCLNIVFHFRNADVDSIGENIRCYLNSGYSLSRMLNTVSAGTGCTPRHSRCPAQIVTSEACASDLVITNHHKLSLLDRDAILSGLFTNYVIDEANHFETAVRSAFSTEVSSRDIKETLDNLENSALRILKRAVNEHEQDMENAIRNINKMRSLIPEFMDMLLNAAPWAGNGNTAPLTYDHPAFQNGRIQSCINAMEETLNQLKKSFKLVKDENTCRMLKIQTRTVKRLKTDIEQISDYADSLKYIEENILFKNNITACRIFNKNWTVMSQKVQVDELIRHEIHEKKDCIIYTAATLCHRGRFDSFQHITGMNRPLTNIENEIIHKEFRWARIPSPFSRDAMEIIIPETAASGKYDNKTAWINSVISILPDLIKSNKGRTLVLFSSYQDLNLIAEKIKDSIESTQYPLLIQKPGQSTVNLCDEFRSIKESVLFGVDTFWYGVDFKGDTLTQVVITRIPYPPPSDPVQTARKKVMNQKEFWERYQYDMEIKMKQGIGRLIRCDTDRGKVVILDSRFKMDPYFF